MKKSIFKKLGGLFLGLAMGLGVAGGVTAGNKASEVKAEEETNYSDSFANMSGASGSYASNLTITSSNSATGTDSQKTTRTWLASYAYYGSKEFRLGHNKTSGVVDSKFDSNKPQGASIEMNWDVANVKSIAFTNTGKYGTPNKLRIFESTNSGTTWTEVASTTTVTAGTLTYTATTPKSSARYAYVVSGSSSPRMVLTTVTIKTAVVPTGFTLSYNANKPTSATGSVGNMPTNPTSSATSFTVDSKVPTLTGYTFKGWGTQSSGIADANLLQPGASTGTISQNTTLYAYWELNKYTVTGNITNGSLENTSSIDHGGELSLEIIPASGYRYPSDGDVTVIMGTTDISEDVIYDENEGSLYYAPITGNVSITATCPPDVQGYDVTWAGSSHVTIDGASKLYVGETKTYTITADTGYKLPEDASVVVEGATKVYEKTSYNEATLTLSAVSGNVTISLAGIALANYGVTFTNEDNFIYDGPENIQEFGEATFELLADDHYDLPASVSVDGATTKSYSKTDGILVIYEPTGPVTITVNPVARERYGITVTGSGDSAEYFTYGGDTEIYQTETATVTIAPDAKGTDDIYVINASNIAVTGVSDWSYSNGVVSLSNPTGNVTITVTPVKKVLDSIEITTEPTKKTGYKNGDTLDTTGLVVKAVFNTGKETIPAGDLKFSQTKLAVTGTAGTAKSETIYVYYHGKSASFNVSVAPVATGASGWEKATSIAVGDKMILVSETASMEMTSISTTSTKYGVGTSITTKPAGTFAFDVVAGSEAGSFSFKNGSNYLRWNSGNSLDIVSTSAEKNSSWYVVFDASGNATLTNANDSSRFILWNKGSPRFATYAGQSVGDSYYAVQLYKYSQGAEKSGVAINASYASGSYTAGEEIDSSNLSTTLVYNDGTSSSVSGATISPSTYVEGTAEYTVTYSTYSTVIQIANVAPAKTMTGIRVDDTNVTKAFVVGGTFDSNGLVVYKVFDNGTEEVLESGYTVSTPDLSTAGTKTVTVTYPGFAAQNYSIEVSDSPIMNIVEGAAISGYEGESYNLEIELLNYTGSTSWSFDPASSEYYEIDVTSEDHSGLVASVTLKKATTEELTVEISEENSGAEPVEITIDVDADYLTGIEVTSSKIAYTDGEYFDYDSVTVTASYASSTHEDEEIDIGECTVTAVNSRSQAFDLDNPLVIEAYTITVEYEDKSDSFNISVSMPEGLKVVIGTEIPAAAKWKKVTNLSSISTSKQYALIYENGANSYMFNNYDANYSSGSTTGGSIIKNVVNGECAFLDTDNYLILNYVNGQLSIKCVGGGLNGKWLTGAVKSGAADNGFVQNASEAFVSAELNSDGELIATTTFTSTANTFRFNGTSGQFRFRFYKTTTTGDVYHYPCIYEKVSDGESAYDYDYVDVSPTLYAFIRDTYTCEGGGLSSLSGWDDAFNTEKNPSYASLTDDDKTILKNGFVSGEVEGVTRESWSAFAGFITSYDRAVASGCYNYLERAKTNPSRINLILALNEVDNSVWIISAVALVGLTAIGGYFFYKKRKEN